ncbi:MAG: hypothetical protein ACRYFX_18270 [Janthinobacterium lividum]
MLDKILAQLTADISKNNVQQEMSGKLNRAVTAEAGASLAALASTAPVLQLNTTPAPIDVSQYKNPFGPANPNGDYISLFKFVSLNNDVPGFTRFYAPSGRRLDSTYQSVVGGASVVPSATFTNAAFAGAGAALTQAKLAALDGTGNSWYPVYANPIDWYDLVTQEQNLFATEIDLTQPQTSFSNQYVVIDDGTGSELTWNQRDIAGNPAGIALSSNTKVNKIRFKFMQVQLNRPWFNLELFSMGGWSLPGQQPGFVSSGSLAGNNGVLPLYTTSFIIGTDLEIEADLDSSDRSLVAKTLNADGIINLGPFAIDTYQPNQASSDRLTNGGYFIIAWISQLVAVAAQPA